MNEHLAALLDDQRALLVRVWHQALCKLPGFDRVPPDQSRRNVERCLSGYRALLIDGDEEPLRRFAEDLADLRYSTGFEMHMPLFAARCFFDGLAAAVASSGSSLDPELVAAAGRLHDTFTKHFTRRFASHMLSAAEDAFYDLLHDASDAIAVLDEDGQLMAANRAFRDLMELGDDALVVGRPLHDFVDAADHAAVNDMLGSVPRDGTALRIRVQTAGPSGKAVRVELAAHRSHARHKPGYIVSLRNVTEEETERARRIQREKLVSVGRLAASMTHELNNPLTWVMGNLQQVRDEIPDFGPTAERRLGEMIDDALTGTRRMAAIIRDLRSFVGGTSVDPTVYRPKDMLDLAVRIAGVQGRGRVRVTFTCEELPQAVGMPGRLSQLFVNLVVNAIEAIPAERDGRVEVTARHHETEGAYEVTVSDNGVGIAPDLLPRLFAPFVTAGKSSGLGLGLWICKEIVEEHGGRIGVDSEPGRTVFSVLVSYDGGGRWKLPPRSTPPSDRDKEALLLVEDEDLLRRALTRQLQRTYNVVAVGSAEAALAYLDQGDDVAVLVSDVGLPGMSGTELLATLERKGHPLARRTILISGVADFDDASPGVPCLRKPFARSDLEAALEQVTGGSARAGSG